MVLGSTFVPTVPVNWLDVRFVMPEPLPEMMPPLFTMRLLDTVTLEVKVCAADQVLVVTSRPAAPEPVIAWHVN